MDSRKRAWFSLAGLLFVVLLQLRRSSQGNKHAPAGRIDDEETLEIPSGAIRSTFWLLLVISLTLTAGS